MKATNKFHFLLVYPLNTAPAQRFRFEQYFHLLDINGIKYTTDSFFDPATHSLLYNKESKFKLALGILVCYLRRWLHVFTLRKYEKIFIQRGAAPFGPPVFEWIIRHILKVPIIYDFDDAIWIPQGKNPSFFEKFIKSYYKVGKICKWSQMVVTGNEYLAEYARKYQNNVMIIPTVVDSSSRFVPGIHQMNEIPVIGWTGSHSTLKYIEAIEPVLKRLKNEYDFEMMIMANQPSGMQMEHRFVKWSEKVEVTELQKIDIGLMPLPDDEWTKGKCGFKLIQYMSLGIAAVASPVGVNSQIIQDGENGFLCNSDEEWLETLKLLLNDSIRRKKIGMAGRKKVIEQYSLDSQANNFISLFN